MSGFELRTLWNRKRPLYQLSHNYCPNAFKCCCRYTFAPVLYSMSLQSISVLSAYSTNELLSLNRKALDANPYVRSF